MKTYGYAAWSKHVVYAYRQMLAGKMTFESLLHYVAICGRNARREEALRGKSRQPRKDRP